MYITGSMINGQRMRTLVTFTGRPQEALSIEYLDLPTAALNQSRTFQFLGYIRDGWPLNTQHFGKQVMGDLQDVIVAAVSHQEQPARQPSGSVRGDAGHSKIPPLAGPGYRAITR